MRFREFKIDEARRNPEQNPKVSLYDALEKYKDDPDIYISYTMDVGRGITSKTSVAKGRNTSGFKIGINPKSKYNTPNGIYTYPLPEMWRDGADPSRRVFTVPFAGEQPAVYIIRATGNMLDLEKYGSDQIDKDLEIVAKKLVDHFHSKGHSQVLSWEMTKGLLDSAKSAARIRTPGGMFWNATRMAFFALSGSVNDSNLIPIKQYTMELKRMEQKAQDEGDAPPNYNDEVVRFKLFDKPAQPKDTNKWNKLFRDMGYDGAVDRKGQEIIHPYEPIQAVFFHTGAFKVVDMVYNKEYGAKPMEWDVPLSEVSNPHIVFGTFFTLHEDIDGKNAWAVGIRIWGACVVAQNMLNTKLTIAKGTGFDQWGKQSKMALINATKYGVDFNEQQYEDFPEEINLMSGGYDMVNLFGGANKIQFKIPAPLKQEYMKKYPDTKEKEFSKWYDVDSLPTGQELEGEIEMFYRRFKDMEKEEVIKLKWTDDSPDYDDINY